MKKIFDAPLIILTTASPMDAGGGSDWGGANSIKPLPCSYEEWQQSRWCADFDQNGEVDFDDFARWWSQNNFGTDAFTEYTGQAWKDEWSF